MKYIIANWKMNKMPDDTLEYFEKFSKEYISEDFQKKYLKEKEIVICVPFIDMFYAMLYQNEYSINIGVQNVFYKESGAYTGEVSAKMVSGYGIKYSIVGHSERRNILKENDEDVRLKMMACISNNIVPIVCIGENIDIFNQNKTIEFLKGQIDALFKEDVEEISKLKNSKIILAYEPLWAIGSGKTCDFRVANEIIEKLKEYIFTKYLLNIPILYGGSINEKNIQNFESKDEKENINYIDGYLVGGASLDCMKFLEIIKKI